MFKTITHAGLLKTGAIDYPGTLSSVIFLPGCNLRCPYCHNPNLVDNINKSTLFPISEIFDLIKKRKNILGGVVITGGEPLIYPVKEIDQMIKEIQKLSLSVKLDTNGTFPEKLALLKPDFIAMDIKTSPERYFELNGGKIFHHKESVLQSIKQIISSGINHEFRTTVHEEIISEQDLDCIIKLLKGAQHWSLASFKPGKTLNPDWEFKLPPKKEILEKYKEKIEKAGIPCTIR